MDLDVYIHGERALSLEADPSEPEKLHPGPAMARMSVGWDGTEDTGTVQSWLLLCLPENGTRNAFVERTKSLLLAHRMKPVPRDPETVLWANTDCEYPGAISLSSDGAPPLSSQAVPLAQYSLITERDIGLLLESTVHEAERGSFRGHGGLMQHRARASLSGMRPKIALSKAENGAWCLGEPGCLNTWIVKVEDNVRLPGEAGVESVCQTALSLAGIRAARTAARVIGGYQCVLSERSDRAVAASGHVVPIHQEELRQAAGWGGPKYPAGAPSEPNWKTVYKILRKHAAKPDDACDEFTRLLASAWLLGHADMHYGNLGFLHEKGQVRLAPAYDVSSAVATRYDKILILGVGGQRWPHKIGAPHWREHAASCGLDVERVLGVVSELAEALPDAFEQARTLAKERDEDRRPQHVAKRCERIARHIRLRGQRFMRTLAFRRSSTPAERKTSPAAHCKTNNSGPP